MRSSHRNWYAPSRRATRTSESSLTILWVDHLAMAESSAACQRRIPMTSSVVSPTSAEESCEHRSEWSNSVAYEFCFETRRRMSKAAERAGDTDIWKRPKMKQSSTVTKTIE